MTHSNFKLVLSAPGKIILFGEHSVVYGKKAVAATLGLYTKLYLMEDDSDNITIQFPSLNLEEVFPMRDVLGHFAAKESDEPESYKDVFDAFYRKHGRKTLTEGQRYSLITFFYSLSHFTGSCSGFTIRVETELPVSSGAGSSASFSVIINTAVILFDLSKSNKLSAFLIRNENGTLIREELMDLISKRAFSCEKIFHGTPSGIDHSVILHGSALEFVKEVGGNKLKSIDGGTIRVLLVDTKVPRSTKTQVEIFKRWKDNYPDILMNILDAMGYIADRAIENLLDMKNRNDLEKYETRMADLINLNHGLLRSVEVSHDSLERICSIGKRYGLAAKLTGAGGGGLCFIYLTSKTSSSTVDCLKKDLKEAGFEANEVVLGGPGLRVESLS